MLEADDGEAVADLWGRLRPQGPPLPAESWREALFRALSGNDLCFRLAERLARPRPLDGLAAELGDDTGREVTEEEVLLWLALGAAARAGDRPLLRPVVHAFVRGLDRAVVDFPEADAPPRLWLSPEAQAREEGEDGLRHLDVTTCTTCGQHYFVHHVEDLEVGGKGPSGGQLVEDRAFWRPLEEAGGGARVVLLDRVLGEEDEDPPAHTHPVGLCRWCGTLHSTERDTCDDCGRSGSLVPLRAVEFHRDHGGYLTACLSCRATGRSFVSVRRVT